VLIGLGFAYVCGLVLRGAYRGRDCIRVFIGVYVLWACTLYCVILKKITDNGFAIAKKG